MLRYVNFILIVLFTATLCYGAVNNNVNVPQKECDTALKQEIIKECNVIVFFEYQGLNPIKVSNLLRSIIDAKHNAGYNLIKIEVYCNSKENEYNYIKQDTLIVDYTVHPKGVIR